MSAFKNRILLCISFFLFWIVYFIFARFLFLSYYFEKTKELGFSTSLKTFLYGLQLDISFSAYLSIVPFLLIIISIFFKTSLVEKSIKWYSYLIICFISLLLLIDAGLYQAWGVRIDNSLLPYLNKPSLMIASVSAFQMVFGVVGWLVISLIFIRIFKKLINSFQIEASKNWIETPVFLLLTAALIIPVRGGFQTIPVNQSNVYFSNKMFANHAAVNFSWNFFNTLKRNTDGTNPYEFFDKETAEKTIKKTRDQLLIANTDSILNADKPNIILILWESLSAKAVGVLGGEKDVTPNLNKLAKEGILFTNFYANGDRTDKGIPAILSGYYPAPIFRIMRMPNKTRSLPMLPKELKKIGYQSSFYYGGDLNFGNMNTYLRAAGIENYVDGDDFDSKYWSSKWGVYDDVFMDRFAKDLSKVQKEPFFKIALTLSSHEPYNIRGEYKFGRDSDDNNYRSANYYTDKTIGKFIEFAKKQAWYKNTLIIIMSDHGNRLPIHKGPYDSPKKFRIPMLWLGGALQKTNIEIDNFSSQVDFSFTVLDLLGLDNSKFKFGKNIFNNSVKQYAHYVFNKGYGTISKSGTFVFDYISKKPIISDGESTKLLDTLGKAITQDSFQDFLNRK